MSEYLGKRKVNIEDTEFKDYTIRDWTLYFIGAEGMYDGAHHKHELLNDIAKINTGNQIIIYLHEWDDGNQEYRAEISNDDNQEYINWRNRFNFEVDI